MYHDGAARGVGGGPCSGPRGTSSDNSGAITSAQGQRIGSIGAATNMAFGGPDGRTLLAVSPGSVRVIPMNLPGLP